MLNQIYSQIYFRGIEHYLLEFGHKFWEILLFIKLFKLSKIIRLRIEKVL